MAKKISMTFLIEPDLQAALMAVCKATDVSAAQVLRKAARDYVDQHAQASMFAAAPGKPKAVKGGPGNGRKT